MLEIVLIIMMLPIGLLIALKINWTYEELKRKRLVKSMHEFWH